MANMLAGTKIVPEPWCPCHQCMCCGSKSYSNYRINHNKRKARRREERFWRTDQERNAA